MKVPDDFPRDVAPAALTGAQPKLAARMTNGLRLPVVVGRQWSRLCRCFHERHHWVIYWLGRQRRISIGSSKFLQKLRFRPSSGQVRTFDINVRIVDNVRRILSRWGLTFAFDGFINSLPLYLRMFHPRKSNRFQHGQMG
jgi:hypothetical protein